MRWASVLCAAGLPWAKHSHFQSHFSGMLTEADQASGVFAKHQNRLASWLTFSAHCVSHMQVFAFLSVTTTNVLATNSPQAPGISDKERKRRMGVSETMLAYTLCVALVMGLCIVLCLETVGPWLLTLIGKNDEILAPATQYLRIRATASPAVMLVMVAQGACFGQQVNTTQSAL